MKTPAQNFTLSLIIMLATAMVLIFLNVLWQSSTLNGHYSLSLEQTSPLPKPALPSTLAGIPDTHQEPLTIIFAGDMMWDRNIRAAGQRSGYDFVLEPLGEVLRNVDMVVANLEGPVTNNATVSLGSEVGSTNNYIFTFDPLIVQTLTNFNIQILNLGNNHILNFGRDGLEQTERYLVEQGIEYFGNTGNAERDQARGSLLIERNGVKLAFVNYNQFANDDPEYINQLITQAKSPVSNQPGQADLVIVYTHWGNEYEPTANAVIQELTHGFIDSGADLIIGSHPHVIQNTEVYNGKTIYYSLGNFVFDQYFQPEVREGLLVTIKIDPESKTISGITEKRVIMSPNGQTSLEESLD